MGITTGTKVPLSPASNGDNIIGSSQNLVQPNTDHVVHHNTQYIFHQSLPENIKHMLPSFGVSSDMVNSINQQALALKLLSEVLSYLPDGSIVKWKSSDQMVAVVQLLGIINEIIDVSIVLPTGAGKTMLPLIISKYRRYVQSMVGGLTHINKCEVLVIPLIGLGFNLISRLQMLGFNVQFVRSSDVVKHFTA